MVRGWDVIEVDLSGAEGVREPPGLPPLVQMLEPVCLSFPCSLHGLAAPVRPEHGFCWGEHKGALGREGTVAATSPVVVASFPKPESNFILRSLFAPAVSDGNAVL